MKKNMYFENKPMCGEKIRNTMFLHSWNKKGKIKMKSS